MAEAIAVVGALSSILQVIEFSTKIVSHTHRLIASSELEFAETESRETERLANEYELLGQRSSNPGTSANNSEEDRAISRLGSNCETKSRELLDQLQSLHITAPPGGVKRFVQCVRVVTRTLRKRKEIERRRQHLQELNGQLATTILQSLLTKQKICTGPIATALMACESSNGDDTEKILSFIGEHKQIKKRAEEIINGLSFPELTSRWHSIEKAYPKTYTWALEDDSLHLKPWLRNGHGMFWITGKAGSGKSTLMKFLCNSQETKNQLKHWSKEQDLVFASFFFWYAGTTLQKSIVGLMRSILHQILSVNPVLAQVAFPEYFNTTESPNMKYWEYDDLVQAFEALALDRSRDGSQKKFCFFIDGLDEYHGEHLELIALLIELAQNTDIKLCVSSRPWNAFRNAFESKVPYLNLEDLSKADIWQYVNERLKRHLSLCQVTFAAQDYYEAETLVNDIVKKAEGVFLWVILVVKSVLHGLEEGDTISMLRHRVQTFPADLEDFFRNILSRVDDAYKWHTSQALKLACLYANEDGPAKRLSTFVDYWLIRQTPQGLSDVAFPYKQGYRVVLADEVKRMIVETRTMLSAACKDLLMLPLPSTKERAYLDIKVEFLHRTVHDFLQADEMQHTLDGQLPAHFHSHRIFHLLNLTRLKFKMPYDSLERIFEQIDQSAEMSMERYHPDLSEEFVKTFESIAIYYHKDRWHDRPNLLITFIAFKVYRYAVNCLAMLSATEAFKQAGFDNSAQRRLVMAAFGEDTLNRFELSNVNLGFIRKLFEWEMLIYDGVDDGGCSYNLWQLILRKWAISKKTSPQEEQVKYMRHVWKLAKMFLSYGASIDETFCSNPLSATDPRHKDVECVAADFLKSSVPAQLLLECQQTQHLATSANPCAKKRYLDVETHSEQRSAKFTPK